MEHLKTATAVPIAWFPGGDRSRIVRFSLVPNLRMFFCGCWCFAMLFALMISLQVLVISLCCMIVLVVCFPFPTTIQHSCCLHGNSNIVDHAPMCVAYLSCSLLSGKLTYSCGNSMNLTSLNAAKSSINCMGIFHGSILLEGRWSNNLFIEYPGLVSYCHEPKNLGRPFARSCPPL